MTVAGEPRGLADRLADAARAIGLDRREARPLSVSAQDSSKSAPKKHALVDEPEDVNDPVIPEAKDEIVPRITDPAGRLGNVLTAVADVVDANLRAGHPFHDVAAILGAAATSFMAVTRSAAYRSLACSPNLSWLQASISSICASAGSASRYSATPRTARSSPVCRPLVQALQQRL